VSCTTLCDKVCQWLATGVAHKTNQNKRDRHVLLETQLTMVHTTKQKMIKLFHIEITLSGMLVCLFDGV
jgi:hypothetical protein